MSDSKPTTKRAVDAAAVRQEKSTRPGPGERCPECDVLFRFCEGCHAWGCKCGDPVSVCQSCHQATCGNCGTPYGYYGVVASSWEDPAEDPPPVRAIAELAKHAGRVVDPEMTAALEEVEQWLSGFALDDEPSEQPDERSPRASSVLLAEAARRSGYTLKEVLESEPEEVVGPVEQEVLEKLYGGDATDDVIDAVSIVARAVDELERQAEEWRARTEKLRELYGITGAGRGTSGPTPPAGPEDAASPAPKRQ